MVSPITRIQSYLLIPIPITDQPIFLTIDVPRLNFFNFFYIDPFFFLIKQGIYLYLGNKLRLSCI